MTTIEKVKHAGAVKALKDRIESLRFELTNRNWEGITCSTNYTRLSEAIDDGKRILMQMEETFSALREMEPANR